jgi:Fic family protein
LDQFLDWFNSTGQWPAHLQMHPIRRAALAHFQIVFIHPFGDSNGRLARLLMNWVLFRAGFPMVSKIKLGKFSVKLKRFYNLYGGQLFLYLVN